eukprot:865483-Prorocentrum_lima.AAC.1
MPTLLPAASVWRPQGAPGTSALSRPAQAARGSVPAPTGGLCGRGCVASPHACQASRRAPFAPGGARAL